MPSIAFIADGPRDQNTVPHLVRKILDTEFTENFQGWPRLHVKGYDKKLLFATISAVNQGHDALVATLDADHAPIRERLRELDRGRTAHREKHPPFPTALGEAVPHLEAWLLDDPVAVCSVLRLAPDTELPTVRHEKNPKRCLDQLINDSGSADERLSLLSAISQEIDVQRCRHGAETGFGSFVDEVRRELKPLI